MIVILSSGHVAPAKLTPYLEAVQASGAIKSTRSETGCIHYDIATSALQDGSLSITEVWDGFPAMQGHFKSEALAKMTEINQKFDVTYETKLYKAEPMGE